MLVGVSLLKMVRFVSETVHWKKRHTYPFWILYNAVGIGLAWLSAAFLEAGAEVPIPSLQIRPSKIGSHIAELLFWLHFIVEGIESKIRSFTWRGECGNVEKNSCLVFLWFGVCPLRKRIGLKRTPRNSK